MFSKFSNSPIKGQRKSGAMPIFRSYIFRKKLDYGYRCHAHLFHKTVWLVCPLDGVVIVWMTCVHNLTSFLHKKSVQTPTVVRKIKCHFIKNATVSSFSSAGRWNCVMLHLGFDVTCSNHRMMSPSFCGSSPYPCSSLTYRNYSFRVHHTPIGRICQRFFEKIKIFHRKSRKSDEFFPNK